MTEARATRGTQRAVLLVTCAASFLFPFMGSSVNVALPSIGQGLGMTAVQLTWVATSFLLTSALLLVPFGWLGDTRGRKRILVSGVATYVVGSALAGFAPTGSALIVARSVQGAGGSMLASTAVAILISAYDPRERGRVLGINAASLYAGLSLGPAVAGFVTQSLGWRAVFLMNVPLGLALLLAALTGLPRQQPTGRAPGFDKAGFTCYAVFLLGTMYGLTLLPRWEGITGMAIGLAALAVLVRTERRTTSPLIDIAMFRSNVTFAMSNVAALLNYAGTFAATFLISLYLQLVTGLTPRAAGLVLISMPLMQAVLSPLAGRLSDRVEPRMLASAGMASTVVALFVMSRFTLQTPVAVVASALALLGVGVGFFSSPNTNAVMTSVESRRYGVASATLSTMRQVGMVLSMGAATVVINAVIGDIPVESAPVALFVSAMRTTLLICTFACLAGIFASLARGAIHAHPESAAGRTPD